MGLLVDALLEVWLAVCRATTSSVADHLALACGCDSGEHREKSLPDFIPAGNGAAYCVPLFCLEALSMCYPICGSMDVG
jgi:hypothetical protein